MECIFCNIANKKIAAKIIFEDENFLAFNDINPKAPVHALIIPKNHYASLNEIKKENKDMIGDMILLAIKLAQDLKISDGYKLCFNVGRKGGQIIDHIHLHLLGGW